MTLRGFLDALDARGELVHVTAEVDPHLEIAAAMNGLGERTTLFERVKGYPGYSVAGGITASREGVALGLGVRKERLIGHLAQALANPTEPELVRSALCQEVIEEEVNLDDLPIPRYLEGDGGRYVTSGVAVIKDKMGRRNMAFHRLMQTGKDTFTARVVADRGTHTALDETDALEVAICIGNSTAVLLAAAMSPPPDVDELAVANALEGTLLVKCRTA